MGDELQQKASECLTLYKILHSDLTNFSNSVTTSSLEKLMSVEQLHSTILDIRVKFDKLIGLLDSFDLSKVGGVYGWEYVNSIRSLKDAAVKFYNPLMDLEESTSFFIKREEIVEAKAGSKYFHYHRELFQSRWRLSNAVIREQYEVAAIERDKQQEIVEEYASELVNSILSKSQ